jgi:hypothetical protein
MNLKLISILILSYAIFFSILIHINYDSRVCFYASVTLWIFMGIALILMFTPKTDEDDIIMQI